MNRFIGVILVLVVLVVLRGSVFVVPEGKQVVVTQFGRPVREVREAGLQWKMPFVQDMISFEKRLLPWEGDPQHMPTKDKRRIYIEAWARWRIVDPMKFYTVVGTYTEGQHRLDELVDSAVRAVVAKNDLLDAVRSTNNPLVYESQELGRDWAEREAKIVTGRQKMEEEITRIAAQDLKETNYGMELVTVQIKRINYIESVRQKVYERMRSERTRIARLYESQAEEEGNKIAGQTQKELDDIDGEMEKRTKEIRGKADAEVIRITAEAFGQAPEFYTFLRRLEAYRKTLGRQTRLILSTDSAFLKQLHELEDRQ
ncbi:MAG: protease modulator HflC [Phycisphaerae bacterium]